jgi:two-component system NtrC family sensor kinase
MKQLLLLLAWVSACTCFAQPKEGVSQTPDTAALRIDRLPAAGLMLQKGWRYHPGDDPAWARLDFDDSGWNTLNPTRPRRAAGRCANRHQLAAPALSAG